MKNVIKALVFILLVAPNTECETESQNQNKLYQLWYEKPAANWTEALPVGNGRLGAMVFGNPNNEKIQFNEESLWAGCQVDNNNPGALEALPEIQKMIFEGRYSEAYQVSQQNLLGTPPNVRSHQTFGDLLLSYKWQEEISSYTRDLSLNTGISRTSYDVGNPPGRMVN